jgi:hypothetical protein
VAKLGSLFAPFLIQGHSSLVEKGIVMLAIHSVTVVCVSQLPETKGSHMGGPNPEHIEDLALTEEEDEDQEAEQIHDTDHMIT